MTGVAIVIPMLNEAAGLPRLLRSLAALEPPPAEVLAVDGGSADASVAIAEAAGLLVVRHETRGRAAAINRGVQEATAPIICVLHADTLLPEDAVDVMRRVLADPMTGARATARSRAVWPLTGSYYCSGRKVGLPRPARALAGSCAGRGI
jgi:glycosyltransferase involved in cell wall biosynthesis